MSKNNLSYYDDVVENLSDEDRSQLRPETQEYLNKNDKGVGEIIDKQGTSAVKKRIWERMDTSGRRLVEDDEDSAEDTSPKITLADVKSGIYQSYESGDRNDLEIELDPLIIEEPRSTVKKLHILVSTTEADHQRFLHQLNRKMQDS